jgi:hypothetical protein
MMSFDLALLALVAAVWLLLALAYALVPALAMPGAALLWGAGGVAFLTLAWRIRAAERGASGSCR